ncbi:hypothetical protein PSAC2689_40163 [Paraburkholderia sacchari]
MAVNRLEHRDVRIPVGAVLSPNEHAAARCVDPSLWITSRELDFGVRISAIPRILHAALARLLAAKPLPRGRPEHLLSSRQGLVAFVRHEGATAMHANKTTTATR